MPYRTVALSSTSLPRATRRATGTIGSSLPAATSDCDQQTRDTKENNSLNSNGLPPAHQRSSGSIGLVHLCSVAVLFLVFVSVPGSHLCFSFFPCQGDIFHGLIFTSWSLHVPSFVCCPDAPHSTSPIAPLSVIAFPNPPLSTTVPRQNLQRVSALVGPWLSHLSCSPAEACMMSAT